MERYATALIPKLKIGAELFWMFGNKTKFASVTTSGFPDAGRGRWYDNEVLNVSLMLKRLGYSVEDSDVGTNLRDPIVWFRKVDR
jgi:hypothetical protein